MQGVQTSPWQRLLVPSLPSPPPNCSEAESSAPKPEAQPAGSVYLLKSCIEAPRKQRRASRRITYYYYVFFSMRIKLFFSATVNSTPRIGCTAFCTLGCTALLHIDPHRWMLVERLLSVEQAVQPKFSPRSQR